jgi:hypothetical protein
MDFMTIIATATKSLEMVKALKDIDKQIGEAELKAKAADLLSNLADLKVALIEAKEEAAAKDNEINKLKQSFQLRSDCVRYYNFLYDKSTDGKPQGQPYCTRCEQIDGVMIKLTYDDGPRGNAICPQCKTKYRHVQVYNTPEAAAQ